MADAEPTQRIPIDPALSAIENFFVIINAKNTKQVLGPQHVTWGAPTEYSKEGDDFRNTEVILVAKPTSKWYGPAPTRYHRVGLSSFGPEVLYEYHPDSTIGQMKADLVNQLELVGTEVKFDVDEIPEAPEGQDFVIVNLVAIEGSLLYIESVPVRLQSLVPADARLEESGAVRYLENGDIRIQDSVAA